MARALCPLVSVALLFTAACAGGGEWRAIPVVDTKSSPDLRPPRTISPPPSAEPPLGDLVTIITRIGFERQTEGVTLGLDLDGRVSDAGDKEGCRQPDFVDPDGIEGIDNQLAVLLPFLDTVGEGAVESLVQGAIDDGGALLLLMVEDVDDVQNDDQITITLRRGEGKPLLGTDGVILSGQSFDLHADPPLAHTAEARLVDGVLEAGPFDVRLPAVVFGVTYELRVPFGHVRARLEYDGSLSGGIMAGGVPLDSLFELMTSANAGTGFDVVERFGGIMTGAADLGRDESGACTALSATLSFDAASAFLFE